MNTHRTEHMIASTSSHMVQICQTNSAQAELLTHYITEGLLNDEAVIVIARPALRKAVESKLKALGLEMSFYKAQGQLKLYDAEMLLANILIDDVIDEHYFHTFIGGQIQAAQIVHGQVRAFGEMVDILWHGGLQDTALQLENLRNELCKKYRLTLLCTYLLDSLDPKSYSNTLERICRCHTRSLPINSFNPEDEEDALLELFGSAWNRVMKKLVQSKPKPASDHLPSTSTSSLNLTY